MSPAYRFLLLGITLVATPMYAADEPTLDASYRALLRQANEPATIRNRAGIEHYRLIFTQSFSVPLIVHVTRTGDRVTLRSVLFTGAENGRVADVRSKLLSMKEWANLKTLASAAKFWSMPFEDPLDFRGDDGSTWIVEGAQHGAYHVVTRWTASYDAKKRQLEHFVSLARFLAMLSPHKLLLN